MKLQSTAKRRAKTSHMPNPTRVGTRAHSHPFKIHGHLKTTSIPKKLGKKGRKAAKKRFGK